MATPQVQDKILRTKLNTWTPKTKAIALLGQMLVQVNQKLVGLEGIVPVEELKEDLKALQEAIIIHIGNIGKEEQIKQQALKAKAKRACGNLNLLHSNLMRQDIEQRLLNLELDLGDGEEDEDLSD